jgi:hypothetical protein
MSAGRIQGALRPLVNAVLVLKHQPRADGAVEGADLLEQRA